ncbi:MAG: DUF1674 domain-containing protein, partial [Xanthomonadales bacterium]|nr:DUF1674 domain-containing protein [Xanthomonadales bacterium]
MKTEPICAPAGLDTCSENATEHISADAAGIAAAPPREGQRQLVGPREIGGRKGADPTRYGDWEKD